MSTDAGVRTEVTERVALLTIDDPDRRNALTLDLSAALADAVRACEDRADVHAVIITGAPPAFCAGGDLGELAEADAAGLERIYAGFVAVARCTLPTIAAVNGAAVGAGLNLALAADVRLVGRKARFDARFLQLGLHPGGGMTWMLQRAVGPQVARAMVLLGQALDAEQAVAHGLALAVHDDVVAAALAAGAAAADAPRELVLATKASMRATVTPGTVDVDAHTEALHTELGPQEHSTTTPEFKANVAAMRRRISQR